MQIKLYKWIILTFLVSATSFANSSYNDPLYSQQWYLNGKTTAEGGGFSIGFEAFKAANIDETNETITFILGAGVDVEHEDLKGSIWINPDEIANNFVDDDNNGFIDDINGINAALENNNIIPRTITETVIASVIAAQQNNNKGITGISAKNKIAVCDVYNELGQVSVESIATCIDYIVSLKTNKSLNISSVLMTFGISANLSNFVQEMKPAFSKLESEGILVVAPVNSDFYKPEDFGRGPNLDSFLDYPASYLMNNIISVAGRRGNDSLAGWGENSVSTIAPSNYIKGASPIVKLLPSENVIASFEPKDVSAESLKNVEVTTEFYSTTEKAWKVKRHNEESYIELPPVNLSEFQTDPFIFSLDYINDSDLGYWLEFYNESKNEWEIFYVGLNYANEWQQESITVYPGTRFNISLDSVRMRLFFYSWYNEDPIDSYIDNITLSSTEGSLWGDTYEFGEGTVYAAAQVSGALALLKANDLYTSTEIRNLIISSGTTIPLDSQDKELSISGKLLTLYGEENNGLFNCVNQKVSKRIFPSSEQWIAKVEGEELIIKGLSINCNASNGNLTIIDQYNSSSYVSSDDGIDLDFEKDDGYNVTQIPLRGVGKHLFTIEGNRDLPVWVFSTYKEPNPHSFIWYDVSNLDIHYPSDLTFKLNFGGVNNGFSDCYIMSYGTFYFSRLLTPIGEPAHPDLLCNEDDLVYKNEIEVVKAQEVKSIGTSEASFQTFSKVNSSTSSEKFIANNIHNPFEQGISIDLLPFNSSLNSTYRLEESTRTIGEIGQRIFILELQNSQYSGEKFEANAQLIFFEENSTIVLSYGEISEDFLNVLTPAKINVGGNYVEQIVGNITPNTSYVFKISDATNQPPEQVKKSIDIEYIDKVEVNLNSLFNDLDGDTLFYQLINKNEFLQLEPFGILGIAVEGNFNQGEEFSIEVLISDGESEIRKSINVSIAAPKNFPPTLDLSEITMFTNEPFVLSLKEYITDKEEENIAVSINTSLPIIYDPTSGLLLGELSKVDYPLDDNLIEIELSDASNIMTYQVLVDLQYKNHAPSANKSVINYTMKDNESLIIGLDEQFNDQDNDKLTFSVNSEYANVIEKSSGISELVVEISEKGSYGIIVTAIDIDGARTEIEFVIEVVEHVTNTPSTQQPELDPSDDSSSGGGAWSFLLFLMFICSFRKLKGIVNQN